MRVNPGLLQRGAEFAAQPERFGAAAESGNAGCASPRCALHRDWLAAPRLRRAAVWFAGSLVALSVGVAEAVPVPLMGSIRFTDTTECSPWCGTGSSAQATILGAEGQLVNGQFHGAGGASTSAMLGGGGFLGKTATATASFTWTVRFEPAPGAGADPFHIFFDWSAWHLASHDALLGSASGGIEFKATVRECVPMWVDLDPSACYVVPTPIFEQEVVYNDSKTANETRDLGVFDPSLGYAILRLTFDVGSFAESYPVIGIYADALDFGTFDFVLRADDGRTPPGPGPGPGPDPVPAPPTVLLVASALAALRYRTVRRPARSRSACGPTD